jgi:hypothetical protein
LVARDREDGNALLPQFIDRLQAGVNGTVHASWHLRRKSPAHAISDASDGSRRAIDHGHRDLLEDTVGHHGNLLTFGSSDFKHVSRAPSRTSNYRAAWRTPGLPISGMPGHSSSMPVRRLVCTADRNLTPLAANFARRWTDATANRDSDT